MEKGKVRSLVLGAALSAATATSWAVEYPRLSPRATVSQIIGDTEVAIAYGRPAVRERVIWGKLVPYNKVWRTGADEVTAIAFTKDVTIEGHKVPAGLYGLYTMPGKEEWTVIFSKDAKPAGGVFHYKESDDFLRFKVKPQTAEFHGRMTISFPNMTLDSAELALCWERVRISFTISTDSTNRALSNARAAVAAAKPDDAREPLAAALFCIENNLNLDEARAWIEKSIAVRETPAGLMGRARIYAAKGKKTEAVATALRAIEVAQAEDSNARTAWIESYIADWRK
jgi:hypothetical protein